MGPNFGPKSGPKNTDSCHWKLKFCNYIMINIGLVLARSIISPFLFSVWLQEKGVYCTKLKATVEVFMTMQLVVIKPIDVRRFG